MVEILRSGRVSRRRFLRMGAAGAGAVAAGTAVGRLPVAAAEADAGPPPGWLAASPDIPVPPSVTLVPGALSGVLLPSDFTPMCAGAPATAPAVVFSQFNQSQVGIYTNPFAYLVGALDVPYGGMVKQLDVFFVVPGASPLECQAFLELDQVGGAYTQGAVATVTGTGPLHATASGLSLKAFSPLYQPAVWVSTTSAKWLCGAVYQYLPPDHGFVAVTPTRVYDSRWPACSDPVGPIEPGQSRLVSVANGRNGTTVTAPNVVPTGASAVVYNLTVTGSTGTGMGWLSVVPASASTYTASSINWTGAGQTLANAAVVAFDAGSRTLRVFCDGASSTHFLIDVTGYYR